MATKDQKTILINKIHLNTVIQLDIEEFLNLKSILSPLIIFRIDDPTKIIVNGQNLFSQFKEFGYFIFLHDNCANISNHFGYTTLHELEEDYELFLYNKKLFSNFKDYSIAKRLNIKDSGLIIGFLQSEFSQSIFHLTLAKLNKYYEQSIDAIKGGFMLIEDWKNAQILGIKNIEIFVAFKETDFFEKLPKNFSDSSLKEVYRAYNQAKELGFSRKDDFEKSRIFGQINYLQYRDFLLFYKNYQSKKLDVDDFKVYIAGSELGYPNAKSYFLAQDQGLKNYQEFRMFIAKKERMNTPGKREIVKRVSDKIPKTENKIKQIFSDIVLAKKSKNWNDLIRFSYIRVELGIEMLYMSLNWALPPRDHKYNNFIKKFPVLNIKKFNKVRDIRNQVVHENLDVSEGIACEVEIFLEEFYQELLKIKVEYLNKFLVNKNTKIDFNNSSNSEDYLDWKKIAKKQSKRFQCRICNRKFKTKEGVLTHLTAKHAK